MKLRFIYVLCLLSLSACSDNAPPTAQTAALGLPSAVYVAHAGGGIDGFTGTNALEAITQSAGAGYTYIELDFMLTEDSRVVCVHDFEFMTGRTPGAPNTPVPLSQFLEYKIFGRYTPIDLAMLSEFLNEHPQITIITDTKDGYAALEIIASEYKDMINRFIPQAYAFEDIDALKRIGFDEVIVTLYNLPETITQNADEINRLVKQYAGDLSGITIYDGLLKPEFVSKLDLQAAPFFAHTINDKTRAKELLNLGFAGLYTDFLITDTSGELAAIGFVDMAKQIELAALNMPDIDKSLFENSLVYIPHSPLYYANGKALAINADAVTHIFYRYITNELYLPLAHFEQYINTYEWRRLEHEPTQMSVTIVTISGSLYNFEHNNTNGPLIHRGMPFMSASVLESVFPITITETEGYIIVAHKNT